MNFQILLNSIKLTLTATDPTAKLILYGSYARGDFNENSDIDLLILLDKEIVNQSDVKNIRYPLYDLEFENGVIISPLVFSNKDWTTKHKITPFYENVMREGQIL